ncbi:MAG TPA: helix-turn-helix domain-containing protein [Amycolatopsis sp.]|uniref:PucR family transcriptional regulator n=1 Tax=Amycolatopsis sp. TaxID=37632 RepID=UPI002B467EDC|nr:helix-turn-helix domain-containing protein [Amycolatopsis sp.]HKS48337.1 helix-turn-helix domain-containing protein [Amycolatopsis sp.]
MDDDRLSGIAARRHRLAAILRPELPSIVEELVREVRRALPEYGRLLDQAQGAVLRQRVEYIAKLFVDLVEYPELPRTESDKTFRAIGRAEGHAGRTLDPLHAAFRIGGRLAWRRIARVERQRALSANDVSWLAERLFAFLDELTALSVQGYRQAQDQARDAGHGLRRRLLQLVLKRPAVSRAVITDLARAAGWTVPEQCAMVALDAEPSGRLHPDPTLGADVLADLREPEPCVLVPGPVTPERLQRLSMAFRGAHIAIGPTVALGDAAASLRWARHALRLVGDGVLPDVPVTVCAEHWSTLWLLTDPALLRQVTKRRLSPLAQFPVKQRSRLAGTLFAWLRAQGNVQETAAKLKVHPRTVRYRMRQIETAFGDDLRDSDARFEIEAALRALELLGVPYSS